MNNHTNILLQQAIKNFEEGNLNQTKLLLENILRIQPKNFLALHIMGVTLGIQNNHEEALNYLLKAVKLNPNDGYVNFNLAKALSETGKDSASLKYHEVAIKINPNHPEAWLNFGKSLNQIHRHNEALSRYEKAIQLKPDYAEAWFNKGVALHDLKRFAEAISHYDQAIQLKLDYLEALCNKGVSLRNLKRYDEAITHYDQAIQLKPDYAGAWFNKGISLHDLKRYDEAITHYDQAIQLKPDYAEAWFNKGVALHDLKCFDEALTYYDQAIKLKPDYFDSYCGKSLTHLVLGDFKNGWDLYTYRWKKSNPEKYRHDKFNELISLDNIATKSILVWYEQGYGDTIQFSRYISKLIELGANVIFEIQKPLLNLIRNQTNLTITSEIHHNSKFDFQIPLLSLPKLFNTNIENIPSPTFIEPSYSEIAKWKNRLKLSDKKFNIGIAISGNPNHTNNSNRSMKLSDIAPLFDYGKFFLIQKEISAHDYEKLCLYQNITFLGDQISDFTDTASIIMNMDLVISVDTSLIHLAGSLNKPSYLMLPWCPEWRWLSDRSDSPWYRSIQIFRQKSLGDWGSVIKDIKNQILIAHQNVHE